MNASAAVITIDVAFSPTVTAVALRTIACVSSSFTVTLIVTSAGAPPPDTVSVVISFATSSSIVPVIVTCCGTLKLVASKFSMPGATVAIAPSADTIVTVVIVTGLNVSRAVNVV